MRIWTAISIAALAAVVAAFSIHAKYGLNLLLTFVNGEASLGFWRLHGFASPTAFCMAAACSSYDTFSYFPLFSWMRRANPKRISSSWIRKLHGVLRWLDNRYVPKPVGTLDTAAARRSARYYRPLFFFGLYPGCIPVGVNYALNFKLDEWRAYRSLLAGNLLKMASFALLGLFFPAEPKLLWSLIGITVFFLATAHLLKRRVERMLFAATEGKPKRETAPCFAAKPEES
ncbi:MAG: hypothetical protein KGJ13_01340 [Patescibacteria group bacterium]|nr:hypothetical protein [Patescibacteria group bacterium]